METLFYSVSFCPLKSLINSFKGRRQFHAGEEGQGGNFGNKRRATGRRGVLLDRISSSIHRTILARIDLLLIQITVRDCVTSWKNIRRSHYVK